MDEDFVNETLLQTHVWHNGDRFFVSTINRHCSSMIGGIYAETIVFDWNVKESKRGKPIWQGEAGRDSIYTHQKTVENLYRTGLCEIDED